jgi:hypothetical protein
MTTWMAEQVGPMGRVHATDLDPGALEKTQRQAQSAVKAGPISTHLVTTPRSTGLESLPPQSLDLIVMVNSVYFLRDGDREADLAYLRALNVLMKPSGRLLYHFDWLPPQQLDKDETLRLFRDAGFEGLLTELPMPVHIPKETMVYPEGEQRDPLVLVRGFIFMMNRTL